MIGVLQEPPFARGGLADRIASEIKTGFGYGFEALRQSGSGKQVATVEILDARKEIGPTPYLDYRPMDKTRALGMTLMAEGPVGLTFDHANATAPAFPNSLVMLATRYRRCGLQRRFARGALSRRFATPSPRSGMDDGRDRRAHRPRRRARLVDRAGSAEGDA